MTIVTMFVIVLLFSLTTTKGREYIKQLLQKMAGGLSTATSANINQRTALICVLVIATAVFLAIWIIAGWSKLILGLGVTSGVLLWLHWNKVPGVITGIASSLVIVLGWFYLFSIVIGGNEDPGLSELENLNPQMWGVVAIFTVAVYLLLGGKKFLGGACFLAGLLLLGFLFGPNIGAQINSQSQRVWGAPIVDLTPRPRRETGDDFTIHCKETNPCRVVVPARRSPAILDWKFNGGCIIYHLGGRPMGRDPSGQVCPGERPEGKALGDHEFILPPGVTLTAKWV